MGIESLNAEDAALSAMTRAVWPEGQIQADALWNLGNAREVVGLGFALPDSALRADLEEARSEPRLGRNTMREQDRIELAARRYAERSGLHWWLLPNLVAGEGHFEVSGDDLHETLKQARTRLGAEAQAVCLWHSHYRRLEPSMADLRNYPEWLLGTQGVAVVYHAPSQTARAYNASGVISGTSSPLDTLYATLDA
jgi:hypothetical protein